MTNDSNHPRNFCYQCKRPLPPDYRSKPWNVESRDHHPMFDSKRCKDIAILRHLPTAFEFTNLTNYLDDDEGTRAFRQRDRGFDPEACVQYDQYDEAEALRDLADEYRRSEKQYDQSRPVLPVEAKGGNDPWAGTQLTWMRSAPACIGKVGKQP